MLIDSKEIKGNLVKRTVDTVFTLVALFVVFPLLLCLMILIKIDSRGRGIISQRRVGKDGREFALYKFRTMKVSTPIYESKPKDDDQRITAIGKLLRYIGLDELPQVFNVLKGNMSLVGPRPEMPFIVKGYTDEQRKRLKVKPGITGLWQISGKTKQPILDNLQYDLDYIKNQSMGLDFKILYRTFKLSLKNITYLFK